MAPDPASASASDPADPDAPELDRRLAVRLQRLRTQRGWTLHDLSSRSGVSRATLSRLERGETSPTASLLNRLCAAHGLSMSRLLAEVEGIADELLAIVPADCLRALQGRPVAAGAGVAGADEAGRGATGTIPSSTGVRLYGLTGTERIDRTDGVAP